MMEYFCKVPDPLIFKLTGYGKAMVAKKRDDEYEFLYGSISLIEGGITGASEYVVTKSKFHKLFDQINSSRSMPRWIDSDEETARLYLFGAYAFSKKFVGLENEKEFEDALAFISNGEKIDVDRWLNSFSKSYLVSSELLKIAESAVPNLDISDGKEQAVFTEAVISLSNPNKVIKEISGRKDVIMTESNGEFRWNLISDYKGPPIPQNKANEITKRNEAYDGKDSLYIKTLITKGNKTYRNMSELTIRGNEAIIYAPTLSRAGMAAELLIEVQAENLELKSANYNTSLNELVDIYEN